MLLSSFQFASCPARTLALYCTSASMVGKDRAMSGRVVLAMSGGVDSSVAAYLLKQQGYEVIGLFMRTGIHGPEHDTTPAHKKGCCSAIDAGDARRVADRLNIPFYALDFEADFERIIDYFADEYLAGRTPNPCVVCNNWLKFGKLWSYGKQLNADFIATGHYAQIVARDGQFELHRGLDSEKDQSYVLFGIRRSILPHLLFPVGGYRKEEVRRLARAAGLGVCDKPDSVEICFVPDNDHGALIRRRRPAPAAAEIAALADGGTRVIFAEPQSAITPGQAVVFYDDRRVLGGGWIEEAVQCANS